MKILLSTPEVDRVLVTRAQSGDRDAFTELVRRHQDRIYGFALRYLGNPEEARDLAQEAFVRIYQGLSAYRGESTFSTWAFVIVRNLCYARSRHLARELAILDGEEGGALHDRLEAQDTNPAIGFLQRDTQQAIQAAMMELPEKYRLVIALHHFQAMKYEEIAEVLGLPVGTVKTHLFRGKALLKGVLEKRGLI